MFIPRKKYNELLKMCYYDKATGAYNRNWFEKNYIENPVHKNISLAVIDINNLKRVNDSNGHFAGDELIKKVNDKLSQYATVVRWGWRWVFLHYWCRKGTGVWKLLQVTKRVCLCIQI